MYACPRLVIGCQCGAEYCRQRIDPRDPDHSCPGIFATHNCARCRDGTDLSRCPTPDRPGNCGYAHARND